MREKENTIIRLVLIRMFGFFVGAIIDRPQTTAKKTGDQWSPLQTDFGRELVFSADLCYNRISKKAFLREESGTA